PPSAQASTIRARNASPCAVFRRLAQFSNVRRSARDNTSGSSLGSAIPPADRTNQPTGTPHHAACTSGTKSASRGAVTTQDRLTSRECAGSQDRPADLACGLARIGGLMATPGRLGLAARVKPVRQIHKPTEAPARGEKPPQSPSAQAPPLPRQSSTPSAPITLT